MALSLLKPAPLRKRLWQGAIALLLVVATFVSGNFFVKPDKALNRHVLGQDFIAFYTAGTFVRENRADDLYNFDAVKSFQHQVADQEQIALGDAFGPYWNPPFYAWLFEPLSHLTFYHAVVTWTFANILAAIGSVILLCQMLPTKWGAAPMSQGWFAKPRDWRNSALIAILVCCSMPMVQALSHGQNTCLSLLTICLVVTAWRARQAELAGMACGLLFYKPQLAAVIAIVLIINLGIRSVIGLGFVGIVLLVISNMLMPGMLATYLHQLPINVRIMQIDHEYLWERHVTLKALWRLLFQGRGAAEPMLIVQILTYASSAVLAFLLMKAAFRSRRIADDPWTGDSAAAARDRLIAATIATTPLLMPFYFDYDLLLLAVPAVLIAAETLNRQAARTHSDKVVTRCFVALYLWMIINPGVAKLTHINVTVLLLSAVATQLLFRAARRTMLGKERVEIELEQLEIIYRKAA